MAFIGSDANAVLTDDGRLENVPAFAFVLGYTHKWNTKFATNASWAFGWLDTPRPGIRSRSRGAGSAR